MIQTRFRQCIKNVYRQYSTSSSASVAPRVGRTLHHNTRMLHQFRYEYSEDELSAELYRLNKSQNPLAAAKQKYYALEPLKTPADALQFVNYLLYTAKMNVARPAHLQATDSYFDYLLEQFEQFIPAFRPADLVSASIALSSANVPLYHPANRALTIAISRALQDGQEFPLKALANLAVFARAHKHELNPYLFASHTPPQIIKYLEECENIQQLRLISVYYSELHGHLTKPTFTLHKAKLKEFMENIDLEAHMTDTMFIIAFYAWNSHYGSARVIRNMLTAIASKIPIMSNRDLRNISTIYNMFNEPASILSQLLATAESRPNKSVDTDLIYCRLGHTLSDYNEMAWNDFAALINERSATDILNDKNLFTILKDRRNTCRSSIFQNFWHKVAENLRAQYSAGTCSPETIRSLCLLYCKTKSPTANRNHRCAKFERILRELILLDVSQGLSGWLPHTIASYARFMIGCSDGSIITLPKYFVERIEQMTPQFRAKDIARIGHALQIRQRNEDKFRLASAEFDNRLLRIQNVVNKSVREITLTRTHHIHELAALIRVTSSQDETVTKPLLERIDEASKKDNLILLSQTINHVTSYDSQVLILVPKLNELMLSYVNDNRDFVSGQVAARLLFHLFKVGYEPPHGLEAFVTILMRDFSITPAYAIVKACIALYFYRVLPVELIARVFSMDFIDRLEKEMLQIYDTITYPKDILFLITQLNRSACLEYPEASIPWLQQKFVDSRLCTRIRPSPFYREVYQALSVFLKDDSLIRRNHITPYGYRIPFVVYFNSEKRLITPPHDEGPPTIYKLAILPKTGGSYTLPDCQRMKGFDQLEARHLTALGYNVMHIDSNEWYSKHMAFPEARKTFFEETFTKLLSN